MTTKGSRTVWVVFAALLALAMLLPPVAAVQAAPAGRNTVRGLVWRDYCDFDCTAGSSLRAGNGNPDEAERGQAGVRVFLARGACGERRPFTSVKTDPKGYYKFDELENGSYCVSASARGADGFFPKPGEWTSPAGTGSALLARTTVTVGPAARVRVVNFGWFRR